MLAILYLIVIFIVGHAISSRALPWFFDLDRRSCFFGRPIDIQNWLLILPASWLIGALSLNWLTFALADSGGNIAGGAYSALGLGLVTSASWLVARVRKGELGLPPAIWKSLLRIEFIYLLLATAIAGFIVWHTLTLNGDRLMIGSSVYSDFGPHLSLIRSFSLGENFPPQYPHYPDGSLRYHFLFHFLVASLEFLGMPIDWAFNLPSMLSLISLFLLLYVLAVAITGSKLAGILSGVLMIFRSSFAVFSYIKDHLADENLWSALWDVSQYIGNTEHENWGLWTQNVYANQRHFAFSLSGMLLILISTLPLLQAMITAQQERRPGLIAALRAGWLCKAAWMPENLQRAATLGLILGALGFWNGAVVISTLLILFVLSFFCHHRLELLIVAILTVALSLLQQRWFISTGASAVQPQLYFGFLAAYKTVTGVAAFYLELLGLLLPLFIVSLFAPAKGFKALGLAFISPLLFASCVALTIDINANHKFIMIAVMLANIPVASLLSRMWHCRDGALKALAIALSLTLTTTGLVDLKTLYNINLTRYPVDLQDPRISWALRNSKPHQIFLTDWAVLHPLQMTGRPIYFGWPYFAWSAGYDIDSRAKTVNAIYQATDAEALHQAVEASGIDFIVIDNAVRQSQEYRVNEALIVSSYPEVFHSDLDRTRIFAVNR